MGRLRPWRYGLGPRGKGPAEAYHGFSKWLAFGNDGVIADNDPDAQEKIIKFNELVANCLVFPNALDMTGALRDLQADGHPVDLVDVAALSPYLTKKTRRFGDYVIDAATFEFPDPYLTFTVAATERARESRRNGVDPHAG